MTIYLPEMVLGMEMRKLNIGIMILVSQNMLYKFDKNAFILLQSTCIKIIQVTRIIQ